MQAGIANMERIMGCKFGDATAMPLLVAVRSGARDSMPGMMDTILNSDSMTRRCSRSPRQRRMSGSRGIVIAGSSRCMGTW